MLDKKETTSKDTSPVSETCAYQPPKLYRVDENELNIQGGSLDVPEATCGVLS